METIIARYPGWEPLFYRTATGAEIDLTPVIKLSRGFWNALDDLNIKQAWVAAPIKEQYQIRVRFLMLLLRTLERKKPVTRARKATRAPTRNQSRSFLSCSASFSCCSTSSSRF